MVGVGFAACVAQAGEPWVRVYTDNFQYQDQPKNNTTFNTWLWREDATGTHTFNVTDEPGCSTDKPCVTLTAMPDPTTPTPYINGEMYNNACARQGIGQPEPQAFDRLPDAAHGENTFGPPPYRTIGQLGFERPSEGRVFRKT